MINLNNCPCLKTLSKEDRSREEIVNLFILHDKTHLYDKVAIYSWIDSILSKGKTLEEIKLMAKRGY